MNNGDAETRRRRERILQRRRGFEVGGLTVRAGAVNAVSSSRPGAPRRREQIYSAPLRLCGRFFKTVLLPKVVTIAAVAFLAACQGDAPPGETVIVFKHSKLFGDPAALDGIIERFEAAHPGIRVRDETLPSGSDEQHQFYVINLSAGSSDFDVFAVDVIWIQEFARAGWLMPLGTPEENRADRYFPAALEAATYQGEMYAVPWFIDAGLLYYREDLLEKHGYDPPETWQELVRAARRISAAEGIYGFVWQGKQYEGLVCNALEFLWSNGGDVLRGGAVVLDSAENRRALRFMGEVARDGVSPEFVTTLTEEPSRRIFGDGRAVFMRNWPYAWNLFQRPESPVRGRVGVRMLPRFEGHSPAATLGGWQLGINAHSRKAEAAERFLRFITSTGNQKALAMAYGFKPALRNLYDDPELLRSQPFLGRLPEVFSKARSRPLTPHYVSLSLVLQARFSAAVAGVATAEEALAEAQRQAEAILR